MAGQKALEDFRNQQCFLRIVRITGRFKDGYALLDVSKKSFERYCNKHPDFYKDACEAKVYYQIMRQARFGAELREKALKELATRIDNGTATDKTLLTVLFDEPPLEPVSLLTPPTSSLQENDDVHGATLAAKMLDRILRSAQQGYGDLSPELLIKIHRALLDERLSGEWIFASIVNALQFLDHGFDTDQDTHDRIEQFLYQFKDYVREELSQVASRCKDADKIPD